MATTIECPGCRKSYSVGAHPPATFTCNACGTAMDLSAFRGPPPSPPGDRADAGPPAAVEDAGARAGPRAARASRAAGAIGPRSRGLRSHGGAKRVLSVGSLLRRTFATWGRNFVPFSVVSVVVFLPLAVFHALRTPHRPTTGEEGVLDLAAELLMGGFALVLSSAVAFGSFETLRGRPAPAGACLGKGLSRLPSVVWTAIVLSVFLLVIGIAFGLVAVFPLAALATAFGPVGPVFLALGIALPTIFASALFLYAIPAAAVERISGKRAIDRSVELGRRNFAPAFWVVVLLTLVDVGAATLATRMAERGTTTELHRFYAIERPVYDVAFLVWFPFAFVVLVSAPLKAVAAAVGYHDLRTAREGIDASAIARVFD